MSVSNAINQDTNEFVKLSGSTMTGALILNTSSPSTDLQSASKGYVDSVAGTLNIQTACLVGTTANLNAVYANGTAGVGATLTNNGALAAFSVDVVSPAINSRVLVKDQSSQVQNGIYTLTTVGSGAVAWVLTRSTDFDTPSEITVGDYVVVSTGTVNGGNGFVQTATVATIGSDNIIFARIGSSVYALKGSNSDITSMSGITGNIGNPTSVTVANGGAYRTSTSAGNTALLQAYDTLGASYSTFATLTANNPPTFDLATGTTIGSAYIYRVGGTDVAITDGGTGASTAADARTNLGLGTIATQNANAVSITGGSITGLSTLTVSASSSGSTVTATVQNTSNTASSDALMNTQVGGSSAGNPYHSLVVSAVGGWAYGLRQSSSNAHVWCYNGAGTPTLSSTTLMILDTSGNLTANTFSPTATSNQLVLGTTRTLTITAPTPATSSRTGTIPDAGANFVFAQGTAGNSLFFTTSGATNLTLPTSGTVMTTTTGVASITGTANQVIASSPTGAVTLSLPQSIATTSSPTFANPIVTNLVGDGSNTLLITNTGAATTLTSTTAVNISGGTTAIIDIITSKASTAGAVKVRALDSASTGQLLSANGTNAEWGNGGFALQSGTSNTNTITLNVYDVDNTTYRTFITGTSGNTPTLAISAPSGGSGTIDNMTIGGTTAAAGTFTTLKNTGKANLAYFNDGRNLEIDNAADLVYMDWHSKDSTSVDFDVRMYSSGGSGSSGGGSFTFQCASVTIGAPTSISGSITAQDLLNVENTNTGASSDSIIVIKCANTTNGSPVLKFVKAGTPVGWAYGLNTGNSNALEWHYNSSGVPNLGSTKYMQLSTSGVLTLSDGTNNRTLTAGASGVTFDSHVITSVVSSSADLKLVTNGTTNSGIIISTAQAVRFPAYGAGTLTTDGSGNITAVSDERLKTDIKPYSYGLSKILDLVKSEAVISYRYNELSNLDQSTDMVGFSAQKVKDIIPEAVGMNLDGYYSFNDRPIIAALVNAITELQQQINSLKDELHGS